MDEYATESAVRAIDSLLGRAHERRASDIHLDPVPDILSVRMRIDGELEPAGSLPKRLHEEIIARLKILSGARTDLHAIPQDGRFRHEISGTAYNMRVSFMPTYRGENAVIRLLPADACESLTFSRLGFSPDHVAMIERALKIPHGLILAAGPTGSGKTTTLRACLSLISTANLSAMTLEDPVEYEIPGVRHVNIRESFGVTFSSGLRSALRQDPDVIMVGEIRDSETARTAIATALTGHLVLSTLHTNSALETIERLSQMGLEPYLTASALKLVISQRLVRATCKGCGGHGCDACRGSGFSGRSVIAEILEMDGKLKDLISRRAPASEIREQALASGFMEMSMDADEKVEWGITTGAEVLRALNI